MAKQHELFRQGALTAWYEAAKPALYVNKTLREWLHTYTEAQRPEAVKLALIYGVTCLRKSFGNKHLSMADLRLATEKGQYAVALSEELPAVKDGMTEIHQMLEGFHQKLSIADMGRCSVPPAELNRAMAARKQSWQGSPSMQPGTASDNAEVHHQPASAKQQKIYPRWWGDCSDQEAQQPSRSLGQHPPLAPKPAQFQPQTAGNVPPLHQDDLVTAAYLDVPSSGYGAPSEPYYQPAARRALIWEGPNCNAAPGKENSTDAANGQRKPLKLKQHLPIKSRVKQQLEQSQMLQQTRHKARTERLQAAVNPRQPASPQQFLTQPGSRSKDGRYSTDEPAAEIADSVLSNPWTAALIQQDCAAPELYCNSTALTRVGLGSWAADTAPAYGCPQDVHDPQSACVNGTIAEQHINSDGVCGLSNTCVQPCESSHATGSDLTPKREAPSSNDGSLDRSNAATATHADGRQNQASSREPEFHDGMCQKPVHVFGRQGSPVLDQNHLASAQAQSDPKSAPTSPVDRLSSSPGTQLSAAPSEPNALNGKAKGSARPRGYANWIGDFGHLDGPRFSKQHSKAWQAHMHSLRDHPAAAAADDDAADRTSESNHDDTMDACDSEHGEASHTDLASCLSSTDGRWDFVKILSKHA